jgi:hypothetical protein
MNLLISRLFHWLYYYLRNFLIMGGYIVAGIVLKSMINA